MVSEYWFLKNKYLKENLWQIKNSKGYKKLNREYTLEHL
jgi:hypothetical protein